MKRLLEGNCHWFNEGAGQAEERLVSDWVKRQVERGAEVVENKIELVNPRKILNFPEGVEVPAILEVEGEFECVEPECPTRGKIHTAYAQHNVSGHLPEKPTTYQAVYDPMRSLFYEVEVVGDSPPLCQTEEYKEKARKNREKRRARAQRNKQKRLAREKNE